MTGQQKIVAHSVYNRRHCIWNSIVSCVGIVRLSVILLCSFRVVLPVFFLLDMLYVLLNWGWLWSISRGVSVDGASVDIACPFDYVLMK